MSTSLALSGPLDLYHADAIRHQLLQVITPGAHVRADLRDVTQCDLAGLQLLCAARRTAETSQGRFVLEAASAVVLEACAQLGLEAADLSSSPSS